MYDSASQGQEIVGLSFEWVGLGEKVGNSEVAEQEIQPVVTATTPSRLMVRMTC